VSKVAEGKGRASDGDLLRFLGNAKGSLFELETQIALSESLCYLNKADAQRLIAQITETGTLISERHNADALHLKPRAYRLEPVCDFRF
jgi:four helix bundle protein